MGLICEGNVLPIAVLLVGALSQFLSIGNTKVTETCYFNKPEQHKLNASIGEFTVYKTRKRNCSLLKRDAEKHYIKTIGDSRDGEAHFLYTPNILKNIAYPIRQVVIYNVSCPGNQTAYFELIELDLEPNSFSDYLTVHTVSSVENIIGNDINSSHSPLIGSITHLLFRSDNYNSMGRKGFRALLQCFRASGANTAGCVSASATRRKRQSTSTPVSHIPQGAALVALHVLRDAAYVVVVQGINRQIGNTVTTPYFSSDDLLLALRYENSCSAVLRATAKAILHYTNQHQPIRLDILHNGRPTVAPSSLISIKVENDTGMCKNIGLTNMCSRIGYNSFYVPNFKGQTSTIAINTELHGFMNIIESRCSNATVHLLCSVYTPFCYYSINPNISPKPLNPCYRLCKYVKDDCSSYLSGMNITWPQILDCENRDIFKNDSRSLIFCPPDIESLRNPSDTTESSTTDAKDDDTIVDVSTIGSNKTKFVITLLDRNEEYKCSPMTDIPFCSAWKWNNVSFPNNRGHKTQRDAAHEIQISNYQMWVNSGCSDDLKYLICSIYAPVCTYNIPITLKPCRAWCQSVKKDCEPSLKEVGYSWPVAFNCMSFPNYQPCFSVPDNY